MTKKNEDPVQSLIDFVTLIKPYHTKIVEVSVEHEHTEQINTTITDSGVLDESLDFSILDYNAMSYGSDDEQRTHGDPYEFILTSPDVNNYFIGSTPDTQAINITTRTFLLAGDQRGSFFAGDEIEVFVYEDDYTATANHTIIVDAVIPHHPLNPDSNSLIVTGDVSGLITGEIYYTYAGWEEGEDPYIVESITQISSTPPTFRLHMALSTPVSDVARNKHFGLQRTRVQLKSDDNIFTIQNVLLSNGTLDSWSTYVDLNSFTLGNVPHTKIVVTESIVPQAPYTTTTFNSFLPNTTFSGHIVPQTINVGEMLTDGNFIVGVTLLGDLTSRFKTGYQFVISGGNCEGLYTTMHSVFYPSNNWTEVYVAERYEAPNTIISGVVDFFKYGMNASTPFRASITHNNLECYMMESIDFELDPPYSWTPPTSTSVCPTHDSENSVPVIPTTLIADNDGFTCERGILLEGDLSLNDIDPDNVTQTLTYTAGVFATVNGATITINTDGSFTYLAPLSSTYYSDRYTYTVTDGDGDIATADVNITLTDPPTYYPFSEGDDTEVPFNSQITP